MYHPFKVFRAGKFASSLPSVVSDRVLHDAADLLRRFAIPTEEVAILLINGFHSKPEDPVKDGDVSVHVIGEGKAIGVCGSGLVDAISAMLTVGVVTEAGRMLPPE